jgi:hypothetical protein
MVAQLLPFREVDEEARWIDQVSISMEDEKMMTRIGNARARGGPVFPALLPILKAIRQGGLLRIELLPVLPCLHADEDDHCTLDSPQGRYCVVGDSVIREVPVTVDFPPPTEPAPSSDA